MRASLGLDGYENWLNLGQRGQVPTDDAPNIGFTFLPRVR